MDCYICGEPNMKLTTPNIFLPLRGSNGRIKMRALFLIMIVACLTISLAPTLTSVLESESMELSEKMDKEKENKEKEEKKVDEFTTSRVKRQQMSVPAETLAYRQWQQDLEHIFIEVQTPPPELC